MMHIQNELTAMAEAYAIISQLSLSEQNRVIDWLKDKVNEEHNASSENGGQVSDLPMSHPVMEHSTHQPFIATAGIRQYRNLKDLLADIHIKSSSDKTLLAAAFIKTKRGMTEFKARDISNALKEVGESVPNITLSVKQLLKKDLLRYIEDGKTGRRVERTLEFTDYGDEIVQRAMENKELMLRRLR